MRNLILSVDEKILEMYDNYIELYKRYMKILGNEDKLEELILLTNNAIIQEGVKECSKGIISASIEVMSIQFPTKPNVNPHEEVTCELGTHDCKACKSLYPIKRMQCKDKDKKEVE